MTDDRDIVLYGASGHANAVMCCLEQAGVAQVIAFIDDFRGDEGLAIDGKPIISFEAWRARFREHPCFIAVGNPPDKRRLAERISAAGGRFRRFHDGPERSFAGVTVGAGSYIQGPIYIGPNSRIGDHVTVMPMTTIGHDVQIGDFCTVCPSCTVGGHVTLESDVFLGSGSIIINGRPDRPVIIGQGATVAAGAVVMKSVRPGSVVMGNPARPLRKLAEQDKRAPRNRQS